jgi:dienelactone hydrolase
MSAAVALPSTPTFAISHLLRRLLAPVAAALALAAACPAAVVTATVPYTEGDAKLQGFVAYDDATVNTKKPGILVCPEWWGLNDYAKSRAKQLAALGYVAFAVDIYGDGQTTKDFGEAGKLATIYKTDRLLTRKRAEAGLAALKAQPGVDPDKIAAVGYCFGGMVALEMVRAGDPLTGIAVFHGSLAPGNDKDGKPMTLAKTSTKILVQQGADDPFVKAPEVAGLLDELRNAGADFQLIQYSGAVHAFTNPDNGTDNSKGIAYNAVADKRSWVAMQTFFGEIFPK